MSQTKNKSQDVLDFDDTGVRVEQNQAEFAIVFCPDKNKELLQRSTRRINLDNQGHYIEVNRSGDLGLIRVLDFDIMIAIYLFGKYLLTGEIEIKISKLKRLLESKEPYSYFINAVKRLVGCRLFTNYWWDHRQKQRIDTDFVFFQYVDYIKNQSGKIIGFRCRFSEKIREQIEHHYLKKYEFKKIRELKGSSKLLYMHLSKNIANNEIYPTTIKHIIKLLGKDEQYSNLPGHRYTQYVNKFIIPVLKEVAGHLCLTLYQNKKDENKIIFAVDLQGGIFEDFEEV